MADYQALVLHALKCLCVFASSACIIVYYIIYFVRVCVVILNRFILPTTTLRAMQFFNSVPTQNTGVEEIDVVIFA